MAPQSARASSPALKNTCPEVGEIAEAIGAGFAALAQAMEAASLRQAEASAANTAELTELRKLAEPALNAVAGVDDRLTKLCAFLRRWGVTLLASAPGVAIAVLTAVGKGDAAWVKGAMAVLRALGWVS